MYKTFEYQNGPKSKRSKLVLILSHDTESMIKKYLLRSVYQLGSMSKVSINANNKYLSKAYTLIIGILSTLRIPQ